MKKELSYRKILSLFIAVLFSATLFAQKDMVQFLAAGKEDANIFANYYTKPFLNTFGSNLNNGWYSTAAPLKTGKFNITIGSTASFVPADEQSFQINPAEYHTISTTGNLPVSAPTMFGEKTSPSGVYAKYNNGQSNILFPLNIPEGSGMNISPLPLAQFSLGIYKGTEIMVRGFPKFEVKGYKAGYIGVGIKHDIKQWMPFMSKLPFDLSVVGAYTSASLDIVGGGFLDPEEGVSNPSPMDYTTQQLNFSSKAWTASLIISKKFPVLTVFGGLKYSKSKTTLDLLGNYPITTLSNPSNPTSKVISHVVDPFSLEGSSSLFGLNAGLRVKMAIMAIVVEGTFVPGGYSSVSAGLSFGVFN